MARDQVSVSFKLSDLKNGNTYWMDEQTATEFRPNEYHGCGFMFEPLSANKTSRIKFRGYLRKNDEKDLHFAKIRFLCTGYSKVYDHKQYYDSTFLAKELRNSSITNLEPFLEDKLEQFCHIHGTVSIENEEERKYHFLSNIGRRFHDSNMKREVLRIFGVDVDGTFFGFFF